MARVKKSCPPHEWSRERYLQSDCKKCGLNIWTVVMALLDRTTKPRKPRARKGKR